MSRLFVIVKVTLCMWYANDLVQSATWRISQLQQFVETWEQAIFFKHSAIFCQNINNTKLHNRRPLLPAWSILHKRILILYWKQASYFQQNVPWCSKSNWVCLWATQNTLEIFNKNCWLKVWICSNCNKCMFFTTSLLWKSGLWQRSGESTGPYLKTQMTEQIKVILFTYVTPTRGGILEMFWKNVYNILYHFLFTIYFSHISTLLIKISSSFLRFSVKLESCVVISKKKIILQRNVKLYCQLVYVSSTAF